ncbi:MAG: Rpn family recombination-promoting nuclease/putative transposase [Prevotella sp.]|nr:Rpn family recombination-promoting nuclease/putative transposase [Prevotella sp.]
MKGKYLDPKADLTFKLIFEHEDLLISLLNALLPLDEGKQIEHVEYLPAELVPENPGKKNSVVDVRCRETGGRHFIVEMQLNWNNEFRQRVVLNAAKAVVKQLQPGEEYKLIQPVYSLNLINDTGFESGPDDFYHDYAIVDVAHNDRRIEGLRFIFIELPKFKPQTIVQKKMAVLWLRFLTEINAATEEAPAELLENPATAKALSLLEKSAYNEGQLEAYDRFWYAVHRERVFYDDGFKKGHVAGREEGREEGRLGEKAETARRMKADGMTADLIAKYTGLSAEEIERL